MDGEKKFLRILYHIQDVIFLMFVNIEENKINICAIIKQTYANLEEIQE